MTKQVFGVQEWAAASVNICTGCEHECKYCYARAMAVRFGRATEKTWTNQKLIKDWRKKIRRYPGRVMFPTTHDITPGVLPQCLEVLKGLQAAGNELLIVSKPHKECIEAICKTLNRDGVMFRFSIGAVSDRILGYWEPNAPRFKERLKSLEIAHEAGFETSVSAEPCLDFRHADDLIERLSPYVTDSIWFGKCNGGKGRLRNCTTEAAEWLMRQQSDDAVKAFYERHKHNPLIKWKESIKKLVGVEISTEAGADI